MVKINGRFKGRLITGVERYAVELIKNFPLSENAVIVPNLEMTSGLPGYFWEQIMLPIKSHGELLWSPCNLGPVCHSNHVVTIHDLAVIEHPEWFSTSFAKVYSILLPMLARKARHIITVSEYSKKKIVERFSISANKVTTIHNGVSSNFKKTDVGIQRQVQKKFGIGDKYLMTLGSLEPRKNLKTLLKAWSSVYSDGHSDWKLVIVGGGNSNVFSTEDEFCDQKGLVWLGRISDEDLVPLLGGCTRFFYLSLYEGFGLPILEAMACGASVVASNTTAIPEISRGFATLVDPLDQEKICKQLELSFDMNCSTDEQLIQHSRSFSWEQSAIKTWELLASLDSATIG